MLEWEKGRRGIREAGGNYCQSPRGAQQKNPRVRAPSFMQPRCSSRQRTKIPAVILNGGLGGFATKPQ